MRSHERIERVYHAAFDAADANALRFAEWTQVYSVRIDSA